MELNAEQKRAVLSQAAIRVVIAGPGSGKSRTAAEAVRDFVDHGMNPRQIVMLTFTNSSAHRFAMMLAPIVLGYLGTVHGFCMRLIQNFGGEIGYRAGSVSIVPEAAQKIILREVRSRLGSKISDTAMMLGESNEAKLIWKEYRHQLKRSNMVDYDQILIDGLALLLLPRVQQCLGILALVVDEAQDSGEADWNIYLAIKAARAFIVGDPRQSVFAFRGGNPNLLIEAGKSGHKDIEVIVLPKNYRSDISICEAANNLMRHDSAFFGEYIEPVSKNLGLVEVRGHDNAEDEIYGCYAQVKELVEAKYWPLRPNYNEIAVLARTNAIVDRCRETLRGLGLPVKRTGSIRMPEDWQFALSCIGLIIDYNNDYHTEAILRHRRQHQTWINERKLMALKMSQPLAKIVGIPVIDPVNVLDGLNFVSMLGASQESCDLIRKRIDVLPNDEPTMGDLLADLWNHDKWNVEDDSEGITVTTAHGAKGHEWDVVMVIGMEEGIFPLKRVEDVQEERRLAFVAMTRARHNLILTHARQRSAYGKVMNQEPSRFLKEIK